MGNATFAQIIADAQPAAVADEPAAVLERIDVLAVTLNGSAPNGVAYVARASTSELWVDRDTLERLHIRYDDAPTREFDGRTLVQVSALRGVTWSISEEEQRLDLHVDPNRLPKSTLSYGLLPPIMARTPDFGGFVNYTLYGTSSSTYGSLNQSSANVSGLFDTVAFGPYGTFEVTTLVNPVTPPGFNEPEVIVLDAYWRWWFFGVRAYPEGVRLRSVLGHIFFVHFRYNFIEPASEDLRAGRWELLLIDLLVLGYFPYRDFRLWLKA